MLSLAYDPSNLPIGVNESNLVIATWDAKAGIWVNLESTVKPVTHTISAPVPHFSNYAIFAYTRPSAFTVSNLLMTPAEAIVNQPITISAVITNTGDLSGNHTVIFKLDDKPIAMKEITLEGRGKAPVTFTTTTNVTGRYTVAVDDQVGTFLVKILTVIPPATQTTASFTVSALSIIPSKVNAGEKVTVSVVVTNKGGTSGSYAAVMKINGAEEGRKEATIAAGANQEITFSVTKNEAGIYNVVVGESISSFTVEAKTIYDQWFYIIAAIVALSTGIAVFLIVRRWFYRRAVAPSFGNIPASREYVLAYNQGLEHYGRGEYDTAIQEYSKAVNVDPKQISAYVNRGITYFVKGEHEKAIADFTQAIALDPNYVIAFYNRGLVYKTTGQEVEAISDFENVIRLGTNRNLSKKAKKLTDELLQTKK